MSILRTVCTWACSLQHCAKLTGRPGGYPKFVSQGFNDAYLPIWLQEAGYNTYYTGKLFVRLAIYSQPTIA